MLLFYELVSLYSTKNRCTRVQVWYQRDLLLDFDSGRASVNKPSFLSQSIAPVQGPQVRLRRCRWKCGRYRSRRDDCGRPTRVDGLARERLSDSIKKRNQFAACLLNLDWLLIRSHWWGLRTCMPSYFAIGGFLVVAFEPRTNLADHDL